MYVLIGGAGIVGLSLAQKLIELGHTVAVIDTNPVACHYAREQIGAMAFEGSAVNTEVLIEAGIRKAGSMAAVLKSDALNLAMVTLAKHYGVPHVLSTMRHTDFAEPLRTAGASHIISTVELGVSTMVNAIEFPKVESIMHFEQGQIEVLKLPIAQNYDIVGRSIAEIAQDQRFPSGSLIIGYQPNPNEDLTIPNGDTVIEAYATVVIVTKPKDLRQIINFFAGSI
jgi:trk system potassium uptake protein